MMRTQPSSYRGCYTSSLIVRDNYYAAIHNTRLLSACDLGYIIQVTSFYGQICAPAGLYFTKQTKEIFGQKNIYFVVQPNLLSSIQFAFLRLKQMFLPTACSVRTLCCVCACMRACTRACVNSPFRGRSSQLQRFYLCLIKPNAMAKVLLPVAFLWLHVWR